MPRACKGKELRLVQQIVAHAAVEALDIAVLHLLAVYRDPVEPQQDGQPAAIEPAALGRQFAQPPRRSASSGRQERERMILRSAPITARAPLAYTEPNLQPRDRLPPGGRAQYCFDSRSFRPALSSIASASSRLSLAFILERLQPTRL